MSRFSKVRILAAAVLLVPLAAAVLPAGAAAAERFTAVGRPATPAEIAAWDIDVGPDFAGLPKGSGSVDDGQTVWEQKCESCHGTFAESNQVFTPLVGGTTAEDVRTGMVAALRRSDYPQRTTFMKVATVSTLFDYIRRAMPWNAPKSLSDDQVYAVLAYLLNLAEIVPGDFVLSDQTIREVQTLMPNRNGMTTAHALWPGPGFGAGTTAPDTGNTVCMTDCKTKVELVSSLPEYAWNAHGNLAGQNRAIGPTRGKQTGPDEAEAEDEGAPELRLAERSGCLSCHGVANKIVGPSYHDIAARYRGQNDSLALLMEKVKTGGEGVWGPDPMPAQTEVTDDEVKSLVAWILAGAPEK